MSALARLSALALVLLVLSGCEGLLLDGAEQDEEQGRHADDDEPREVRLPRDVREERARAGALEPELDRKLARTGKNESRGLIRFVEDRPGHDRRDAIDASKVQRELGWCPRYSFDEALEKTVDWYLEHPEWVESVRSGEYRKWMDMNYGKRKGGVE